MLTPECCLFPLKIKQDENGRIHRIFQYFWLKHDNVKLIVRWVGSLVTETAVLVLEMVGVLHNFDLKPWKLWINT